MKVLHMKLSLLAWVPLLALACAPPAEPTQEEIDRQRAINYKAEEEWAQKRDEATLPKVKHPDRVYQLEDLKTADLNLTHGKVKVWIMDTDGKRAEGMMFLKEEDVAEDQGMLFVFPKEQEESNAFWMKNTPLPLDIVYIDSAKRVVNVGKGVPYSEAQVPPQGPYLYVLELREGGAERLKLTKGAPVNIPAFVRTNE